MRATPVLLREVRSESRRPFTYWLRVLGAGVALLGMLFVIPDLTAGSGFTGRALFAAVNTALFIAIWTLVPLLTADSLSQERREGTLGLLLLTPLTPATVVLAKSLVQMLRAFTLVFAVVPVLAVAFLFGGVGWFELVNATCLNLGAVAMALAAGLCVSAGSKVWHRAAVASVVLSWFVGLVVAQTYCVVVFAQVFHWLDPNLTAPNWPEYVGAWLPLLTGFGGAWADLQNYLGTANVGRYLGVSLQFLLVAWLVLWLVVRWSATRITGPQDFRRVSGLEEAVRRLFFEPLVLRQVLRDHLALRLQGNPIGWLQGRTTTARLTKWGWCLALVLVEAACMTMLQSGSFARVQVVLALSLWVGMSLSAASSFREERDSGALELILVSPLTEGQILRGRLGGLYTQFLPATLVLAVFLLFSSALSGGMSMLPRASAEPLLRGGLLLLGAAYLFLPMIGLLYSVTRPALATAWGRTVVVGLFLPWVVGGGLGFGLDSLYLDVARDLPLVWWFAGYPTATVGFRFTPWVVVAMQGLLGWFAYRNLHRSLRERQFTRPVAVPGDNPWGTSSRAG